MIERRPTTRDEIFQQKAEQRKVRARAPFEWKLQELLRMQRMHFAMKQAVGRKARAAWHTPEISERECQ